MSKTNNDDDELGGMSPEYFIHLIEQMNQKKNEAVHYLLSLGDSFEKRLENNKMTKQDIEYVKCIVLSEFANYHARGWEEKHNSNPE
jgi:hypothetical protein